ncbi:Ionotropic receptor 246 [Blattella germanica]|nr:Ionotropic receptor 246 [Blattella germanica]
MVIVIIDGDLILNNEDYKVIDCIAAIGEQYLDANHILSFSKSIDHFDNVFVNSTYGGYMDRKPMYRNNIIEDLLLGMLHRKTNWFIIISPMYYNFELNKVVDNPSYPKHGSYIFTSSCHFGDNMSDITDIMQQMYQMYSLFSWNERAKILAILSCPRDSDNETALAVKALFKRMKSASVYNAVILVPQPSLGKVDIYNWYPYQLPSGKCRELHGVELVDTFENGRFIHAVDLFPNKFPRNFQGCSLIIAASFYPPYVFEESEDDGDGFMWIGGLEPRIISYIANYLNANVTILKYPRNISFYEVARYIYMNQADIVIGNLQYSYGFLLFNKYLFPHFIDKYTWFVPRADQFPRWLCITRVFDLSTWIVLFLIVILTAFVSYLIIYLQFSLIKIKKESASFDQILCYSWSVLLGIALPKLPQSMPVRMFFILFVIFCFAVNSIVQTYLITFILDPGYLHQMDSIKELLDSNLQVFMSDLFFGYLDYIWYSMESVNYINDEEELMEKALESRNSAIFTTRNILSYFTDIGKIGRRYFEFSKYSVHLCSVFLVDRGWPFVDIVNSVIMRLVQAGLNKKIMVDVLNSRKLKRHHFGNEVFVPLAITHLQAAFIFLFIGMILGLIAFLIELSIQRFRFYVARYTDHDKIPSNFTYLP